ncbi:MAG: hypothetical protein ACI84K_001666 [Pseudohongiellaceae bacterium]
MTTQYNEMGMPKLLKNIIITVFSCYLLLCGLIWIISPWVATHYLTPFLAEKNLILSEKSVIRYNPFITKISVSKFALSQSNNRIHTPAVSLNSAEVEVDLWSILSKKINVSQLDISGLQLNIDKSEEQLMIAGWPISSENSDTPTNKQSSQKTEDDYTLNIPGINIVNSSIKIDWLNHKHIVDLSKINLSQLSLSPQKQQGNIALSIKLNNSPINLGAEFDLDNLKGKIDYTFSVKELDLANFNHFIFPDEEKKSEELSSGLFSLNYQQNIDLDKTNIKTQFPNIDLSLSNLVTRTQGMHLSIANQKLKSSALELNIENWSLESPKIYIKSDSSYEFTDFNTYTTESNLSLAIIKKLSIPNIELETVDSKYLISLPNFVIEQGDFSDDTKDDTPSLARFKSINLFDIKLSENGISINTIDILGLGIDIKRTAESDIAGLIKPSPIDSTNNGENKPEETNALTLPANDTLDTKVPAKQFTIALNQIKLLDTSHINIIDESFQPAIERFVDIKQLDIGPFDNQNPEQLTLLTAEGKSNKYANFKLQAESKPFSSVPYYKLNALFNEVSLPEISAYIKDALRYEFDSGQLDLEIDVTIVDTDIKGETRISLRGLELGAANNPNDETIASSTSIPFNYALGMLKDGDGNVELDIPIKGKTTDPSFSLQGFATLLIKRATMSAAKDYLITTFVPYANIVKISMVAGEYLLKVRFNDLPFATGDSTIPVDAAPFLGQFSALMQDKEETELTICAYAIPQDIGITSSTLEINNTQHQQLKALSITRMNTFKDYMVNEQGIKSSRLLLCSPKVDTSENAKARLTFSD